MLSLRHLVWGRLEGDLRNRNNENHYKNNREHIWKAYGFSPEQTSGETGKKTPNHLGPFSPAEIVEHYCILHALAVPSLVFCATRLTSRALSCLGFQLLIVLISVEKMQSLSSFKDREQRPFLLGLKGGGKERGSWLWCLLELHLS